MSDENFVVRPLERSDREWVAHFLDEHWGSTQIISRGRTLYGHLLPGFVAERPLPLPEEEEVLDDDETAENPVVQMEKRGLLTYNLENQACEILTINSLDMGIGIGTALVEALVTAATEVDIKRLWVITTNDNMPALRFWQKRDFRMIKIHRDAVQESRRLKPQIPLTGVHDIPIYDEIELEYLINS